MRAKLLDSIPKQCLCIVKMQCNYYMLFKNIYWTHLIESGTPLDLSFKPGSHGPILQNLDPMDLSLQNLNPMDLSFRTWIPWTYLIESGPPCTYFLEPGSHGPILQNLDPMDLSFRTWIPWTYLLEPVHHRTTLLPCRI